MPEVNVTYQGMTLEKDKDYTVSYRDNIVPGRAAVTITGIGNYTQLLVKEFNIKALDIAGFSVSGIEDKIYTGSAVKQSVVVIAKIIRGISNFSKSATSPHANHDSAAPIIMVTVYHRFFRIALSAYIHSIFPAQK